MTGGSITGSGTIGLGTELAGLNSLSSTGFIKRTAAGTYGTSSQINLSSEVTGTLPIGSGGTGATDAATALTNLLPSQNTHAGKVLGTNGTSASWVPATSGTVTSVTSANGDISVANTTSTPQLTLNTGTGANQILKLNASSQIPAVSGALLTNLNASNIASGTIDAARLPAAITNAAWTESGGNVYRGTGNVGVGTAAPAYALDVRGASGLSEVARIVATSSGGQVLQTVGGYIQSKSEGYGGMVIENSGGSAELNFMKSRGTLAAPTYVQNNDWMGAINFRDHAGTHAAASIQAIATQNHTAAAAGGALAFSTIPNSGVVASERMRIDQNGNVGIGTTNPSDRLQIHGGNLSVRGGSGQRYLNATNTAGNGIVSIHDSSDANKVTLNSNGNSYFQGGNVGIGTTSPTSRLDVNGQIRSASGSVSNGSIDWDLGNAITTSFDCGTPISFANLRDGGSYTLAVTGSGINQCDFSTTTTGADGGTVSYRFKPANGSRQAGSHTIYSMVRIGTVIYVSWITGF